MAMIWSPSTSAPGVVDREHPVGVAVEREADVGARRRRPPLAASSGWVEPQPSLMLRPSGVGVEHRRRRRRARAQDAGRERGRGAVGAVEHDRAARRGAGPRATPTTCVDVARRARSARRRPTPTPSPTAPPAPARRSSSAVELGLDRAPRRRRSACGRRRAKSLMPLSANGLCDAEIIAAGHAVASARRQATAGRRQHAERARRRRPRRARPAASAASSSGPGAPRVAADDERRSPPEHRGPRRGRAASDELGGELGVGDAADAVGAEPQRHRASRGAISAWSTAAPCGPS